MQVDVEAVGDRLHYSLNTEFVLDIHLVGDTQEVIILQQFMVALTVVTTSQTSRHRDAPYAMSSY